jgi:hypothetical protein
MQGFTTVGRPDSRTAQSALRPVFMDVAVFRLQRELSRARPRLLGSGGCTRGRGRRPGRVVRPRGRSRDRSTAGRWQRSQIHAGHRVRGGEPQATGFRPVRRPPAGGLRPSALQFSLVVRRTDCAQCPANPAAASLQRPQIPGHRASLRPPVSAQICSLRAEKQQVSEMRQPRTPEHEPSQVGEQQSNRSAGVWAG